MILGRFKSIYQGPCRNCKHSDWAHENPNLCSDISYCGCLEFVPKDNLEYLEYRYEQSIKSI